MITRNTIVYTKLYYDITHTGNIARPRVWAPRVGAACVCRGTCAQARVHSSASWDIEWHVSMSVHPYHARPCFHVCMFAHHITCLRLTSCELEYTRFCPLATQSLTMCAVCAVYIMRIIRVGFFFVRVRACFVHHVKTYSVRLSLGSRRGLVRSCGAKPRFAIINVHNLI